MFDATTSDVQHALYFYIYKLQRCSLYRRMKVLKRVHSTNLDAVEIVPSIESTTHSNTSLGLDDNSISNKKGSRDRKHAYSSLIAGIFSGAISSTICAPLDLVRTRIQVMGQIVQIQQERRHLKDHIAVKMIQDIIQKDGLAGCFRGLTATLLTVPTFWGVYCSYQTSAQFAVQRLELFYD